MSFGFWSFCVLWWFKGCFRGLFFNTQGWKWKIIRKQSKKNPSVICFFFVCSQSIKIACVSEAVFHRILARVPTFINTLLKLWRISLITVWKVIYSSFPCSIFSKLKVLNCFFFFPPLPSLQVHSPRALRGSRSAVLHQNLCQVQEKHRGASNRSVNQSARLDHRCSAELRMRASLLLMELKQLNLLLSMAN